MAQIVIADHSLDFDGESLRAGPLGGAESAVIEMAEALAARGHDVSVHNKCSRPRRLYGVDWKQLSDGVPESCDLYVANRSDWLIPLAPGARRRAFWIHNPAGYLMKWRYLSRLWRFRPTMIFLGSYHLGTYPRWAPGGERVIIPLAVPVLFRQAQPPETPPPPRAIFASNPLRGLDWLLSVWCARIRPASPNAELHLFTGPSTYGATGAAKAEEMSPVLQRALRLADDGVVLRGPVPKARLVEEMAQSRAMLYRGDRNETFCLAVAEAQAAGVPCVVQDFGSMSERVIDGETGFVARDDAGFAENAARLLNDDDLWRRQSDACIAKQRGWTWDDAACAMERLLP